MKNVTITVSEDLLARARLAAAREGVSLSKFVAEQLSRALGGHADPLAPFDRWLTGPGWGNVPPAAMMRETLDEHGPGGAEGDAAEVGREADGADDRAGALLRGRADPALSPGPLGSPQEGDGTP